MELLDREPRRSAPILPREGLQTPACTRPRPSVEPDPFSRYVVHEQQEQHACLHEHLGGDGDADVVRPGRPLYAHRARQDPLAGEEERDGRDDAVVALASWDSAKSMEMVAAVACRNRKTASGGTATGIEGIPPI
ncbi:hypothetical protein INS49_002463 [Diaporthe citri]|uniref:uncharacterized protein n=1 Tax=Diaporthe citri TaxID=83186 RepID=UPI001C80EBE0|nr:uncharacterized protein INS49_002463 [Diaporthe citri]KAG6368261.1 hypothetical protein INS49_002463 [Diaporthe citri]